MRGKGKKPTLCIEDLGFSFSLRSAGDLIPYATAVFLISFYLWQKLLRKAECIKAS